MPNLGGSCDNNGDIDFAADGSILVCRANRWQRVAEPPPSVAGEASADEMTAASDE